MGGIIGSGIGYQKAATSGLARASADEIKRDAANDQLDAAETSQKASLAATGAVAGGVIGARSSENVDAHIFAPADM